MKYYRSSLFNWFAQIEVNLAGKCQESQSIIQTSNRCSKYDLCVLGTMLNRI